MGEPIGQGSKLTTNALSSIIATARALLNEASPSFWEETEMLDWANKGILDIYTKSWCVEDDETNISLLADTYEYDTSEDFLHISTVLYKKTGRVKTLKRGSRNMLGHVHDIGEPTHYYTVFRASTDYVTVGVMPTPLSTWAELGTIDVSGTPQPTPLTAVTQTPVLPIIYETALAFFIASMGMFKDNEEQIAANMLTSFNQEINYYRAEMSDRGSTTYKELDSEKKVG